MVTLSAMLQVVITLSCGTLIVIMMVRFFKDIMILPTNTWSSQNISWKSLAYKYNDSTLSEKFNVLITLRYDTPIVFMNVRFL
jgi:hypothetical protein